MRTPIRVNKVTSEQLAKLDELYRQSKDPKLRERAQIILLATEQEMLAPEIGRIVRRNEQTVRIWIKRFNAEGIEGLKDNPRPGAPKEITPAYEKQLIEVVRQRPRSLKQPYSLWTLRRLADYMAEETGLRFSHMTVKRILAKHDIVLRRPQHTVSSPDPEYKVKKKRLNNSETT